MPRALSSQFAPRNFRTDIDRFSYVVGSLVLTLRPLAQNLNSPVLVAARPLIHESGQ